MKIESEKKEWANSRQDTVEIVAEINGSCECNEKQEK